VPRVMNTDTLISSLHTLRSKAVAELKDATNLDSLEHWRITYLGRRGDLTQILRGLGSLTPEDRRSVGGIANFVKEDLERELNSSRDFLRENNFRDIVEQGRIDVTLPGRSIPLGRLHPTTQVVRQVCSVFASMGFQVMEGPEVEWDYYNFQMLNIPKDHPARDMWDTLWVDYTDENGEMPMLLRTQTSPMQVRIMENIAPPIRVVMPGKCYRYEATDATHEWQFFQIEGLVVDEGVTFADMKGTLYEFARMVFGSDRKVRFRADYFPFVEPGAEMAIDCFLCRGAGCRTCKNTGWIEIMGAGMVHSKVLEGVGYDSSKYTGFAFGMGPERIAMLNHGIDDIRLFYSNDLRFLRQF